ncbi:helix-turn-helix domain-containing protein [Brenneria tiliae]|uniref:Helix-turn-helix transcriptional regulator n=1 Tax=Brenneria tiliae TaxID=2914984 RepID=A0ABT0MWF1_9GAMM|nr:helix-turn-helix transcriptional regulator [Brenneria tiliae]MCL2893927.1 helix-turn-helix transcriptional regulator [Brenneria tiliae]
MLPLFFQQIHEEINNTKTIGKFKTSVSKMIKEYNHQYYSIYQEEPYPLTKCKSYYLHNFDDKLNLNEEFHKGALLAFNNTSEKIPFRLLSWHENVKIHFPEIWSEFEKNESYSGYSIIHQTSNSERVLFSIFKKRESKNEKDEIENISNILFTGELIAKKFSQLIFNGMYIPSLTLREIEIMRWASEGKTSSDIGKILVLSTSTINFHIANILEKLAVPNKVAAIAKAICYKLI